MRYDSNQLSLISAQAAQHLHAVVSHSATALLDVTKERILFSNSALSYLNGSTMLNLARLYLAKTEATAPALYTIPHTDSLTLYFIVLDSCHVFVVIGKAQDELRVKDFSQRLGHLLTNEVHPA